MSAFRTTEAGVCGANCGEAIDVGDLVVWINDAMVHLECEDPEKAIAAEPMRFETAGEYPPPTDAPAPLNALMHDVVDFAQLAGVDLAAVILVDVSRGSAIMSRVDAPDLAVLLRELADRHERSGL